MEFWVCPATSTTYNWEIKKTDNSTVANGTLSEANSYKDQKLDLLPAEYYIRVTKQNGGDYEREINFTVFDVAITTPAPANFPAYVALNEQLQLDSTVTPGSIAGGEFVQKWNKTGDPVPLP